MLMLFLANCTKESRNQMFKQAENIPRKKSAYLECCLGGSIIKAKVPGIQ